MLKKKKYSVMLVNDDKANFIQDHCHKHKDDCNGIFSRGEILGSERRVTCLSSCDREKPDLQISSSEFRFGVSIYNLIVFLSSL